MANPDARARRREELASRIILDPDNDPRMDDRIRALVERTGHRARARHRDIYGE
jgi:hypothetical protein